MTAPNKEKLQRIFQILLNHFGPQHWWPGETQLEIILGAVLTQNTNWKNVEKAINQLKDKKLMSLRRLIEIPVDELAQVIRPAGYFNVKAKRIKNLVQWFYQKFEGDFNKMSQWSLTELRSQLLTVNGVGPETADSILLYALSKPIFVVDSYTKRFMTRHNWVGKFSEYHDVQKLFMKHLPHDSKMFNEYHALIVQLAKQFCTKQPTCDGCPLNQLDYSIRYRCKQCYRSRNWQEFRLDSRRNLQNSTHDQCQSCSMTSNKKV